MDNKYRALLQRHQQDIIKDLDITYIIDELYTKKAISNEVLESFTNLPNRTERTKFLLESILQNGTNTSYQAFVDSLSKDYHWLWEKFNVAPTMDNTLNSSFEDSLSRGDVPRLPEHYVRRVALEKDVVSKLQKLTRHKILALHGMPGSGKTSVAVGALRYEPDLINTTFNGIVFWLHFGNCKTQDDVISQQNKLYRKASSMYTQHSYMNSSISMSSIGSNADTQSLSSYDWTWQDLRDKLKVQFSEQTLKESLLVLDEVNEKKYLEAFDIGCKILITTRDTDVVDKFQAQIIKIGNNFEEKESLELFALCLDVETSKLPRQAKKLHDICRGNPFSIAMLGAILAENKQRLTHDAHRWTYYVNKLQKKDFLFLPRHDDPIKVFINALDSNTLQLFKMLAILPDNAKVSAKVIGRLWNKDVSEVESIMKQLRRKCLIIEEYIQEQKNYFYEVHDLIMNCLRSSLSEDEMKKLHAEFLKRYNYNVNNAPVDIVDDGYIAYYIGHHLSHTKNSNNMWSLFNKLFLNLKFLGNKVKLTGPADVISDLQQYEQLIVVDRLDEDLLFGLKAFLSTHGIDLYRYPCTDLVQSILHHESKGILYNKAVAIATENTAKNELYFEFLHEQNVEEIKHSTIDVKESIRCVCFLGDYVLVGTMAGSIKVFDISTNNLKKELRGNGSPIKWVGACPVNPPVVAALEFDGVLTIWYIDDVEQEESDRIVEEDPDEADNNNYRSSVTILPKTGPIISCRWASDSETLITHTAKMVILYDSSGNPVQTYLDLVDRDRELLCCVPSNDHRYLVMATSNNSHFVDVVDLRTKEKVMSFEESETVLDILTVPGSNKIIILMHNEIVEHALQLNGGSHQNYNICRSRPVISSDHVRSELTFLAVAVNKAGTLLFVSTDDSRVICIDLKSLSRIFDLENRRGDVISMAVSEVYDFLPGSDVLLTGTGTIENSAKVWYLDPSYVSQNSQKNGKVRLTTKFDVSFVESHTPPTPSNTNGTQSTANTPKRINSFALPETQKKRPVVTTQSLDRNTMKPCLALNLKGISNGNDGSNQPLLAVVDDKNNIQIMRGRKLLTEIVTKADEKICVLKISPCNRYIVYGLPSGSVMKYKLRSKETRVILDVNSPVHYLNFVTPTLLVAAGKNRCLMACRLGDDGTWMPEMLQKGNCNLGSQEILNDIQGIKHKNGQLDKLSNSSSDSSLGSRRLFPTTDNRGCLSEGTLVNCFWIQDRGLLTVEYNATVKLWDQTLLSKLPGVLNGRQPDVHVNCAAFQRNVLVICDDYNKKFQTFELKDGDQIALQTIQEYKLNNKITCCDLTSDGYILAMGLDSGDVVLWNVHGKRQLRLLKHHKAKVQWCAFSPVPDRLFRSSALNSPAILSPANGNTEACQPPLVLVTMAAEIVWWDITYVMKNRPNKSLWSQDRLNVVTPLASPLQLRDLATATERLTLAPHNYFFRDGVPAKDCWKELWQNKTCKEGSRRKEILACIKLSGMNAKKMCFDEKFSCFVTVDNPGHVHIMKLMTNT